MAEINTYPLGTPAGNTRLAGTQMAIPQSDGTSLNLTRNFTIESIAPLITQFNLGYTVYTALITQTGTAAPVATVLQNTTGGTIVWTRPSNPGVGRYVATISGASYTANKTVVTVTSGGNSDMILRPVVSSTTTVDWYNIDSSDNAVSDTISATTTVEIRIYS
tara:strand:+ start:457 stop:945 length:489 start_codon:yes stop_codon:yes gene_type:complete